MSMKLSLKIAALAGLCTGIVILIAGFIWDKVPFNSYANVFWLLFMPVILFFMLETPKRKYLINMNCSFVIGLIWGLIGGLVIKKLGSYYYPSTILIDLIIVGLMVFVHKGPLGKTVFNSPACAFLGFAETFMCMSTSFPYHGKLLPPMSWNGIDLFIVFILGSVVTYFISLFGDVVIGWLVISKLPKTNQEKTDKEGEAV